MTRTTIELRHAGEGYRVEARTPQGRVVFDGDGGAAGSTPMQHLLAAVGACALMDVSHILRKKRLHPVDLRVTCEGEQPQAGFPKPFRSVRLVFRVGAGIPDKAFQDAVQLAMEKYCNVGATLRSGLVPAFEARVDAAAAPDPTGGAG